MEINTPRNASEALNFTCEWPSDNRTRLLDPKLTPMNTHVCREHQSRPNKQPTSHDSAHSKPVMTSLKEALNKSCAHKVESSFNNQATRLSQVGFPSHLVPSVRDKLLQNIKQVRKGINQKIQMIAGGYTRSNTTTGRPTTPTRPHNGTLIPSPVCHQNWP